MQVSRGQLDHARDVLLEANNRANTTWAVPDIQQLVQEYRNTGRLTTTLVSTGTEHTHDPFQLRLEHSFNLAPPGLNASGSDNIHSAAQLLTMLFNQFPLRGHALGHREQPQYKNTSGSG